MAQLRDRIVLAEYFSFRGYNKGAEIGVADGRYSEILCEKNPKLELFCIDPWTPYNGNWRGVEYQEKAYNQAKNRLAKYNAKLIRKTSMEAVKEFKDGSLDFVFIDGSHRYELVKQDIEEWSKKVRVGGVVSGHDYYEFKTGGVIQAVDEYVKKNGIKLNLTEVITDGHKDDRCPCWWWVKRK